MRSGVRGRWSGVRERSLKSAGRAAIVVLCLWLFVSGHWSSATFNQPLTPDHRPLTPAGWREATPGHRYAFPRDHAAHPDYRIEWWYYTGNVEAKDGRRFGYQLTFFRVGVTPAPANPSRWTVRDLYMTHFAISDIGRKSFHSFERINRAGIGWAGANAADYRVWNDEWEARLDGNAHLIKAGAGDFALDLRLAPEKPEVIHGENGISQRGATAGIASHYYSLTRLRTAGRLTVAGEVFEVQGLSWMDHEFGTSFLEKEQSGWDWFSIQLDDGRELMIFQVRRADGSISPQSSGTLIDADGRAIPIRFGEFTLTPGRRWRSTASNADYPVAWEITLPGHNLRLNITAAFEDQELRTAESAGVTYWEGSVLVEGTADNRPAQGRGYLEMTGYAGQHMGAILN